MIKSTICSFASAVIVGAASLGPFAASANAQAVEAFDVDAVHSTVVYRIKHMDVAYFYGAFWGPTGSYQIDFDNPSASSITIEIDASKVASGNDRRDNHLRSADFFNAAQFPTITFEGTDFETVSDGVMRITGDLTMIGQTKPVEVMLEWTGEGETPQGYKSGFEASFKFNRSEWGMDKFLENNGLGDEISIFVGMEGKRAE